MTLRWEDGDRILERLVEVTAPLDPAQREAYLARLVLLLADAVGDGPAVLAAIDAARQ
jgi:hypothetical protein